MPTKRARIEPSTPPNQIRRLFSKPKEDANPFLDDMAEEYVDEDSERKETTPPPKEHCLKDFATK